MWIFGMCVSHACANFAHGAQLTMIGNTNNYRVDPNRKGRWFREGRGRGGRGCMILTLKRIEGGRNVLHRRVFPARHEHVFGREAMAGPKKARNSVFRVK